MLEIVVPGRGRIALRYLLLDMNGTLAADGKLLPGVPDLLKRLAGGLEVQIITGNTWGSADEVDRELGIQSIRLPNAIGQAEEKADYVAKLGADQVVAIGNGSNDALMLKHAALGIAVVGPEGASTAALLAADIVVGDILTALGLLLVPRRISSTLRV